LRFCGCRQFCKKFLTAGVTSAVFCWGRRNSREFVSMAFVHLEAFKFETIAYFKYGIVSLT